MENKSLNGQNRSQIPITAGELAKIASVGGQLGIGAEDITEFTEIVAKYGDSDLYKNSSPEEQQAIQYFFYYC